jgi:hypothetical protein
MDPIGFNSGQTNLTAFCGNSPTNGTDPTGTTLYLNLADDPADPGYRQSQSPGPTANVNDYTLNVYATVGGAAKPDFSASSWTESFASYNGCGNIANPNARDMDLFSDYGYYFRRGNLGFVINGPVGAVDHTKASYQDIRTGNYGKAFKRNLAFTLAADSELPTIPMPFLRWIADAIDPCAAKRGADATQFTVAVAAVCVGFIEGGGISGGPRPVAPAATGTLTAAEEAEVQALANRYNTTIDVVGSRAAGQGRNIGTNLPVGKDPPGLPGTTRSDIDFRIDTSHPQASELISDLQKVGNGAGSAGTKWGTNQRPTYPPVIRFSPKP